MTTQHNICGKLRSHALNGLHRNPDGPEAAAVIESLVEALEKCRDKFLHYEQLHRLKCTADGDEKADRNREMADMCDSAIALVRT